MKVSTITSALLFILALALALPAGAQLQQPAARQNAVSLEEGLLDKSIRTQTGEDVGEIEDVIFSRQGRISHLLVDVGGFLGIGEKTVALNMGQIRLYPDYAVFQGTREDLENMPEVDLYAFRRPYRGYYGPYYGPGYGYGMYGRPYYGYGPYGPAYGPYQGPYGGGAMQDQRNQGYAQRQDQWQERGFQQDQRSYQGRQGMRQGRGMQQERMRGGMARGISGDLFLGAQVINQWNENIGEIEDLLVDPSSGRITGAVIEVGGFWDIGDKHVVVPYNELSRVGPYYVMYRGTEEQLEQLPAYERGEGGRVTRREQTQRAGGQGRGQTQQRPMQQREYQGQFQQQ
jgi:sporulation protein YlmC with PRC-barrel domain